jgi:hypothetical protein
MKLVPQQNIHFTKHLLLNSRYMKSLILGICLFLQAASTLLIAQSTVPESSTSFSSLSTPTTAMQPLEYRGKQSGIFNPHTIGFGISTTDGDATTGKQSIMLSALYSYSFSPTLDLELTFQQMNMSKMFGTFMVVSSAFTPDLVVFLKPFPLVPRFRLGIGSAVRWQRSAITYSGGTIDPITGIYTERLELNLQDTFAVGATLKFEYIFPLLSNLDLSIRAQGHIYAVPILGVNISTPSSPGGAASLGVFFLLHL